MRPGYGSFGSFLLLTAVLAGVATIGCASTPRRQETGREERRELDRVYDSSHGDYHSWNDRENLAYRRFLAERHREYRDFFTLKDEEPREYWTWRHSHPDTDHDRP